MTIKILNFELITLLYFEMNIYFWIQSINGIKYYSNMIILKSKFIWQHKLLAHGNECN